jgi:S-adenosylmethionine synthetase
MTSTSDSEFLFTSESVTEGHPDKIADQISDSILDAMLTDDPTSRVAVETLITTGQVHVAGEVRTETYVDIADVVRKVVLGIGYDSSKKGFDGRPAACPYRSARRAPTSRRASRRRTKRAPASPSKTRSTARAPATRA